MKTSTFILLAATITLNVSAFGAQAKRVSELPTRRYVEVIQQIELTPLDASILPPILGLFPGVPTDKIVVGDTVKVIGGRWKGRSGEVILITSDGEKTTITGKNTSTDIWYSSYAEDVTLLSYGPSHPISPNRVAFQLTSFNSDKSDTHCYLGLFGFKIQGNVNIPAGYPLAVYKVEKNDNLISIQLTDPKVEKRISIACLSSGREPILDDFKSAMKSRGLLFSDAQMPDEIPVIQSSSIPLPQ